MHISRGYVRLFFLSNFLEATFIQGATFIPDSRLSICVYFCYNTANNLEAVRNLHTFSGTLSYYLHLFLPETAYNIKQFEIQKYQPCSVVYDRNLVSISATETKIMFRYRYRSLNFFCLNRNFHHCLFSNCSHAFYALF